MSSVTKQVALVTGASGFIGGHLALKLLLAGWEVHLVVRSETDPLLLAGFDNRATVHLHDGTTDDLQNIVSTAKPQIVFHLASLFLSEHRPCDIEPLIRSNLLFASQLVEAMVQNGVFRLVNTGTSWQHYEGRDYSPVNLYAATKQAFEAIISYYVETTQLRVVTLKLYDTYGPCDRRKKLLHLLQQVAKSQEPLSMSPGEQLIDLVHVDDVVAAYERASQLLFQDMIIKHEAFAVSSGQPVRLKDLVAIYGKLLGRALPINMGGRPYRNREVMIPWHTGKILPGWQPRIPLEDGLRELIASAADEPKA